MTTSDCNTCNSQDAQPTRAHRHCSPSRCELCLFDWNAEGPKAAHTLTSGGCCKLEGQTTQRSSGTCPPRTLMSILAGLIITATSKHLLIMLTHEDETDGNLPGSLACLKC